MVWVLVCVVTHYRTVVQPYIVILRQTISYFFIEHDHTECCRDLSYDGEWEQRKDFKNPPTRREIAGTDVTRAVNVLKDTNVLSFYPSLKSMYHTTLFISAFVSHTEINAVYLKMFKSSNALSGKINWYLCVIGPSCICGYHCVPSQRGGAVINLQVNR